MIGTAAAGGAEPAEAWSQRPLAAWLVEGGDDRLCLDPESGLNRYGCGTAPEDPAALAFGSSTASTISLAGACAAEAQRARLAQQETFEAAWRVGTDDTRRRLADLCGLPDWADDRISLSPSGTDVCGLAADLARGDDPSDRLAVILPDPAETGRGAPGALCPNGAPITVAIREADGRARKAAAVDAEVEQRCEDEIRRGGKVLVCLLDVSKTGLIAPSPAAAQRLKAAHGERLSVLVDACQFRLGAASLAAYLDRGFDVAITGSKFLAGPTFSGALLRARAAPRRPPEPRSLGVLLRWEAALAEFAAFRALEPEAIARAIDAFGDAVAETLAASTAFELLPAPPLKRFAPHPWDTRPTIFSFLPLRDGRPLESAETDTLYRRLNGVRLGQPVRVGERDGRSISVLRIALSARQIVAACAREDGLKTLADGARRALGRAAQRIG